MTSIISLLAQGVKIQPSEIGLSGQTTDPNTFITNALNAVYVFAGVTAVLVIIIAGYLYVTSSGNPANVKRARDAILYSVVGLIVIIMAFTITQVVIGVGG